MEVVFALCLRRIPWFRRQLDVHKQRLITRLVRYVVTVLLVAVMASSMLQLSFVDGLYFVIVTGTTIGYGDITPTTDGQRVFTVFIILFMLYTLSVLVGAVTDMQAMALRQAMARRRLKQAQMRGQGVQQATLGAGATEEPPVSSQEEMNEMKDSRAKSAMRVCALALLVEIIGGGVVFAHIEGWTVFEGVWFCFVTLTTIGYGDFSPHTQTGRLVFLPYALFGLGTMAYAVTTFSEKQARRGRLGTMTWIAIWERHFNFDVDERIRDLAPALDAQTVGCCKKLGVFIGRGGVTSIIAASFVLLLRRIPKFRQRTIESQQVVGQFFQFFALVVLFSRTILVDWGRDAGLTYTDTLYFDMVTATTVGYGDVTPPRGSRLGQVFYIFLQLAAMAALLDTIAERQAKSTTRLSAKAAQAVLRMSSKMAAGGIKCEQGGGGGIKCEQGGRGGMKCEQGGGGGMKCEQGGGGGMKCEQGGGGGKIQPGGARLGSQQQGGVSSMKSNSGGVGGIKSEDAPGHGQARGSGETPGQTRSDEDAPATAVASIATVEQAQVDGKGGGDMIDLATARFQVKVTSLVLAVLIVGGGTLFAVAEDWTFIQGVYFATVTVSSVGYGDFVPQGPGSRAAWVPFATVGLATISVLLSALSDSFHVQALQHKKFHRVFAIERRLHLAQDGLTDAVATANPVVASQPPPAQV